MILLAKHHRKKSKIMVMVSVFVDFEVDRLTKKTVLFVKDK